jgi:hypothetical protein
VTNEIPPDANLRVAMLSGTNGDFAAQRLEPMSVELKEQFRSACESVLGDVEKRTLVPYEPGRKPDRHEAATATLDEVPPLMVALGALTPPGQLAIFDPDGDLARQVDVYIVTVETDPIRYFVRSTSPKKRLKQTNRIAAIMRGQVFESLEDDPLLFDLTFDAVVVGIEVYILNQSSFERSLGFLEAARAAAESIVTAAIAGLEIANVSEFLEAVTTDVNMIAKTRSIARRLDDPDYAARMTVANLVAISDQHPELHLDWEEDEHGAKRLVFLPDPQHRWRILKVLDDDYVQSLVTELIYESNSKHRLA